MARVDQREIVAKQVARLRELADAIEQSECAPHIAHTLAPAIMECVRWLYQANANQATYDIEDAHRERANA